MPELGWTRSFSDAVDATSVSKTDDSAKPNRVTGNGCDLQHQLNVATRVKVRIVRSIRFCKHHLV
jgi:hypothetical protein